MTLDAQTSGEVFRKDHRTIIASNRQHATIFGGRIKYLEAGYYAGQCLALNNVSNVYEKYASAGSSGTGVCVGVLFNDVLDMNTNENGMAQIIFKGEVFYANCIDIDADAIDDLNGRKITNTAVGADILIF